METLRPRLPPQESVEESQQEELEAKQISTPGTKHHLDEEFGYIADDIMRYYSSRNIGNDSQKSIRKISWGYDEPELISMANEAPETMQEKKYNSFNRFSDSKEVDYDELMEQLNAISYQFTLSDLEYDELENAYVS